MADSLEPKREKRFSICDFIETKSKELTTIQVLNCHISYISLPIFRTICIFNIIRRIFQLNWRIVYITTYRWRRSGRMPTQ